MELRFVYNMGDIFIFDIDGCIMPNIFPLVEEIQNDFEIKNQEIIKKVSNLSLYPEFIEFYKNNCKNSLSVYFVTGRKTKYYKTITETQLKPIRIYKNYFIKFFPDNKSRDLKEYFKWKVNILKDIINHWSDDIVKFHIYDDFKALFPLISKEISPQTNDYNCNLIQEQADWDQIKLQI